MAKSKQQKENEVKDLAAKMAEAKGIVFTSYHGMSVAETEDLRKKFRAAGVEYQASKKRLVNRALDEQKIAHEDIHALEGSIATAFGTSDEISAAKVAKDFAKTNENFQIRSGLLKVGEDWKFLSAAEVLSLANLPSREELLAKLVGTIKAPVTGFVNVLAGNIRGLVNVLNAIKENKN